MSPLRAATSGATPAWGLFSSPIGIPRLAIRVGAAASTIIRCNGAGGKTRHAARRPHVRFGQNRKSSMRAYVFRFNGHADLSAERSIGFKYDDKFQSHWFNVGLDLISYKHHGFREE